jgi:hypothetical protein
MDMVIVNWRRIEDALGRLRAAEQEMEFSRVWYFICDTKKKMIPGLPGNMDIEFQETCELHAMAMERLMSFRSRLIPYPDVQQQDKVDEDSVCKVVAHDIAIVRHVIKLESRKYNVDMKTGIVSRHQKDPDVPFPTIFNVQNLQQRLTVIQNMLESYVQYVALNKK